jgi:hypothetical protein
VKAPAGAIVGLYVDLVERVDVDDVIETQTGRCYRVLAVRVQQRGKAKGRHHLRCLVLDADDTAGGSKIHRIRWYKR